MKTLTDLLLGVEVKLEAGNGIIVGVDATNIEILNPAGNKRRIHLGFHNESLTQSLSGYLAKRKIKTLDWSYANKMANKFPIPHKDEYIIFLGYQFKTMKFIKQLEHEPQSSWYEDIEKKETFCDQSVYYQSRYYIISKEPVSGI